FARLGSPKSARGCLPVHVCPRMSRHVITERLVSALFPSDRKRAPLGVVARLFDALTDPHRRERTAAACIIGFVAVWTLYALIAKGSQDIHQDVGELVGWSREPGLGYNHPPLGVWVVTLWFWAFPRADWAAHLLAATNAGVTLWICWKLFGD